MQRKSEGARQKQHFEKEVGRAGAGFASHSILLSTVQYLYVHPIVLTWVALPAGT